jgi:hypothetical protein
MSKAALGRKHSEEALDKFINRKHSEETIAKISASVGASMLGRELSEETQIQKKIGVSMGTSVLPMLHQHRYWNN